VRILYMANNWVGWKIAQYLTEQGDEIAGVVLHSESKRRYGQEIMDATQVDKQFVLDGAQLTQPETFAKIKQLSADIALSIFFGHILRPPLLEMFDGNVVNLHPAYLPYNRGAYPNVWSIVDGTPAGATLHYVDESVDTGDIIAQQNVEVEPVDTGASLYEKLEHACVELFQATWPMIRSGSAPRMRQSAHDGTAYRMRDVERIDFIDLDEKMRAGDLINILRARTFPPHRGAYYEQDGKRVYLGLNLEYDSPSDEPKD
jgi:methionyl-tRNA formyltransferase